MSNVNLSSYEKIIFTKHNGLFSADKSFIVELNPVFPQQLNVDPYDVSGEHCSNRY